MGIKDKISKTILDKDIKKPLNTGDLMIILDGEDPEVEEICGEMMFCLRCNKKTETSLNKKNEKFCKHCGLKRLIN